jgi:phosphonatase-like hydrolase
MIQLAIFDLAGTTVDDGDAVQRALEDTLHNEGVPASRQHVNAVMGIPKPVAIRRLLEQAGCLPRLEHRIPQLYQLFENRMIELYLNDPAIREFPEVSLTFDWLRRRGVKVALDTGFNRAIANVLLDRMGWIRAGLVQASICADEVARGRPHPDMVFSLMNSLAVADPARVAKIGDTPADLAEGTAAGCGQVIGVTCGSHSREQLSSHPHTHLVACVADLRNLWRPLDHPPA